MRFFSLIFLLLISFTCAFAQTGTNQTQSTLLGYFADGQAPGSIVPEYIRDLIVSIIPGTRTEGTLFRFGASGVPGITTWTVPATDGVAGQRLVTNGDGTTSWETPATGVYTAIFSSSDTWTISGATHGLGTCSLVVQVMETSGTKLVGIQPGGWECETESGANQYDITISFETAQAGVLVLVKSGGSVVIGGGGDVSSVFGRTGAVVSATNDYSFSQISGTAAVNQGGTGGTTASAARVNLLPSYTDQAGKCLKVATGSMDVEWSECGSGTVSNTLATKEIATLNTWGTLDAVGGAGNCASKNVSFWGLVSGSALVLGVPSTLPTSVKFDVRPGSDVAVVTLCNVGSSSVSSNLDGTYTITLLEVLN